MQFIQTIENHNQIFLPTKNCYCALRKTTTTYYQHHHHWKQQLRLMLGKTRSLSLCWDEKSLCCACTCYVFFFLFFFHPFSLQNHCFHRSRAWHEMRERENSLIQCIHVPVDGIWSSSNMHCDNDTI